MIYPPMEVIAMGVEEVFRWSRNRLELNKTNRVKQIVQSLEEVLSLVRQHKIGGELPAARSISPVLKCTTPYRD